MMFSPSLGTWRIPGWILYHSAPAVSVQQLHLQENVFLHRKSCLATVVRCEGTCIQAGSSSPNCWHHESSCLYTESQMICKRPFIFSMWEMLNCVIQLVSNSCAIKKANHVSYGKLIHHLNLNLNVITFQKWFSPHSVHAATSPTSEA